MKNLVENNTVVSNEQCKEIKSIVKDNVLNTLKGDRNANGLLKDMVYYAIRRDYKNHFKATSYKNTLACQYAEAVNFVTCWSPDEQLKEFISEATSN